MAWTRSLAEVRNWRVIRKASIQKSEVRFCSLSSALRRTLQCRTSNNANGDAVHLSAQTFALLELESQGDAFRAFTSVTSLV